MCTGKRQLAVQENFGKVTGCECGTVHVTVGPVSVALDLNSLHRLHRLLGAALRQANSEEPGQMESMFFHSGYLESKKVVKLKH